MIHSINRRIAFAFMISFCNVSMASWNVSIDVDPMTDVKKGHAVKMSNNKVSGTIFKTQVALIARCFSDNSVDVIVNWDQFLNSRNSRPIEVRVDTKKVKTYGTRPSTDGTAQFVNPTGKMIADLLKGKTLKLRTADYQGSKTDVAVFDLTGFDTAWREACSWHPKYDSEVGYTLKKK